MTSNITSNSLAAANAVGVQNIQFVPTAETLPRKILIAAHYDKDITTIEDYKLHQITSPEHAGSLFGFGHEIYRLAKWIFLGSQGIETWVCPDPDEATNGTPTYAYGSINVTAVGVLAGTLHLYIAGEYVPVTIYDNDDATAIETAIVTAINADKTLPITASISTPTPNQVNTISQDRGVFGNYVKISFNENFGENFPTGVSVVVVQPTGGSGSIDLSEILNALGLDDEQNEKYFTDFIHSDPDLAAAQLNTISNWNGTGNDFVGNYAKLVARPLRSLNGDTVAGSSGLSALITLGDGRKQDRTNGVIAVPGTPNHPQEIAALAIGNMARINNNNAAESYVNTILQNVYPGAVEDRWTSSYSSRDTAVKAGISPTIAIDGIVKMQNVVTFYHPDDVPSSSNGYRSMRNISILQNITNSIRVTFEQEKWQRISIVNDIDSVTDLIARQKVKDIRAVQNEVIALAKAWETNSWIYAASFTINQIKTGKYIEIRPGGTGFDIIIPIIFSGENWITNTVVQFDTALTVFTQ